MKDADREPEHEDPGAPPRARPAWVDEQAAAMAPGARRERPGRLPRQPVPGRHEEDGLWEHALEIGLLVTFAAFLAAVIFPHAVEWWMIMLAGAAVTAATGYNVLRLAGSVSMAAYFTTWEVLLTGWLIWARHAGPWHGRVIFALLLPVLVLIPTGVTVIRRHRDRVRRAAQLGRDTAQSRECRHWEDLLPRLRVHGVAVKDVIRAEGGYQVHCRLGKIGGGGQVATRETLRDLPQVIAQHKRLPTGAVYIEEEPAGGSAADFIIHVRTVTGPRLARYLPAENRLLSINRPFGLGVLGTGREFCLRLREVVVFVAGLRGSGKALAVDTPIATPSGWTTMGEIQPGDYVFDESGKPCRVLAATDVMHGRPCYEVEFSDGTVITADRDHLWLTWDSKTRKSYDYTRPDGPAYPDNWATWERPGKGHRPYVAGDRDRMREFRAAGRTFAQIGKLLGRSANAVQLQWRRPEPSNRVISPRTTAELVSTVRAGHSCNHAIPAASPMELPDADLPVDPYVLGYLLGDGDTWMRGRVACDPQDRKWLIGEFQAAGYDARPRVNDPGHFGVRGITSAWQALGLDRGKVIPAVYLRGSVAQRVALVQGLVDADGHVDGHGSYRFTNTNRALIDGFRELVTSLGCVSQVSHRPGRVRAGQTGAESWEVIIPSSLPLARLPRKVLAARHEWGREQAGRYITAIRRVPSVPVKCIEVDSPSHLYLAGDSCVPTHNSTLLNVIIAQLARMPDALIFMIDLKGGQEARAWLMPWIQGLTGRPVIDWLATTREEAKIMLDALWLAGTARAESGRYGRKLRPGIQRDGEMAPAMIVICDETAVMTGHFINESGLSNLKLAVRLVQIAETFRSVAIDPVVAAVRAVVDTTGNSGLKAMAEVRIGMRVATAHEGRQIFPDNPAAAKQLAQLKDRGMGIPQVGAELSPPVHFYNITDGTPDDDGHPTEDRITPVVMAVSDRRPQPEQLVRDAMNTIRVTVDGKDTGAYDARWEQPHIAQLIETWRQEAGVPGLPPQPRHDGVPGQDPGEAPGEVRDAFDALVSQDPELRSLDLGLDEGGDDEDRALNPVRKRMRELLIERGASGYQSGMLWHLLLNEGFSVARETVCRWLAQDEKLGYVWRSGKHRSKWIWMLRPGAEFDIPGMSD